MSIIPLRSDAIAMYIRDKNAKHKNTRRQKRYNEKIRDNTYFHAENKRTERDEQAQRAIIWSRPNLA